MKEKDKRVPKPIFFNGTIAVIKNIYKEKELAGGSHSPRVPVLYFKTYNSVSQLKKRYYWHD